MQVPPFLSVPNEILVHVAQMDVAVEFVGLRSLKLSFYMRITNFNRVHTMGMVLVRYNVTREV